MRERVIVRETSNEWLREIKWVGDRNRVSGWMRDWEVRQTEWMSERLIGWWQIFCGSEMEWVYERLSGWDGWVGEERFSGWKRQSGWERLRDRAGILLYDNVLTFGALSEFAVMNKRDRGLFKLRSAFCMKGWLENRIKSLIGIPIGNSQCWSIIRRLILLFHIFLNVLNIWLLAGHWDHVAPQNVTDILWSQAIRAWHFSLSSFHTDCTQNNSHTKSRPVNIQIHWKRSRHYHAAKKEREK